MKRFISFITSLTAIKRPQLVLGGLWILITLSLICISSPAFAITLSPAAAAAGILTNLFLSLGNLIQWASVLFVSLIINIILPGQNSLIFGTELQTAWSIMLDLANIVFFLALFVFAILIITRQAGYNFKKAATALITAIALANLSLVIVQVLIEMGDALRNFSSLIPAFGMQGGNTEEIREWLNGLVLPKDFSIQTASGDIWAKVWISFEVMAAQAIIAYVLFRLVFILVERAIRLAILAIFGPIQAALSILPQKELQGLGGSWFSDVLRWVLVLPLSFILIGIAKLIMPLNSAETLQNFLNQAQTPDAMTDTGTFFYLIIGLGILVAASTVPALLKVPISSLTSMIPNAVGKTAKSIGQSAWKSAKGGMSNFGKDLGFKAVRGTGLYKTIARTLAARKVQIGEQAKQRASYAQKLAREVHSKRYTELKQTLDVNIKSELDAEAVKKGYNNFKDWENDATLNDIQKRDRDKFKQQTKEKYENSTLGLNVSAYEKAYMAAIGEEIESEAKKDRDAEGLEAEISSLKQKIDNSNGTDTEAKIKLAALLMILKRQTLQSGTPGDKAAEVFNRVAAELEGLRPQYGIIDKVSLRQVNRGRSLPIQGDDLVKLASSQQTVTTLQSAIDSRSALHAPGSIDKAWDDAVRRLDERTLKIVHNLANNVANDLARVSRTNITAVSGGPLKTSIDQVLGRTDLSTTEKQRLLTDLFNRNGITGPDNTRMTNALGSGIGTSRIADAQQAAMGLTGPASTRSSFDNQIDDMIKMRTAQNELATTQRKIDTSVTRKDSFVTNVSNYINLATGNRAGLENDINSAIEDALEALTHVPNADLSVEQAINQMGGPLRSFDPNQLSNLISSKLNIVIPGKDLTNGINFAKDMTVKDTINTLMHLQKAL